MRFWTGLPLEKLTLLAVLAVGAFYLFVLPPNSAPDEPMHFQSAYYNVNAVLGQNTDDVTKITMRAGDAGMEEKYNGIANRETYERLAKSIFLPIPAADAKLVEISRASGVPHPYIYFPQTLGMLFGRMFQANPEWLFLLGRIFNLIFYAVCIWMAIKLAPVGKGVFALVALYPMALELAASLSSDTYTTALAFLALAQYLRIAYADGPARWRDLLMMLLTMALMGPPKVVFIPMMMLALFLPGRCFGTRKMAVLFRVLVAAVGIATVFIALYVYVHRADGGVPVVTFEDIEVNTVNNLVSDPVLFAKTCKRTLEGYFGFYLFSMIGSDLGWLDIHLNKVPFLAFLALSVVPAFKASAVEKTLLIRDRLQFPLIFLVAALGTAIVMFLSWTPVGSWDIIGLQGRYYLPAWPLFILFAARWAKPVRPSWLSDKNLVLANCCLQVFVLVSAYIFISGRNP